MLLLQRLMTTEDKREAIDDLGKYEIAYLTQARQETDSNQTDESGTKVRVDSSFVTSLKSMGYAGACYTYQVLLYVSQFSNNKNNLHVTTEQSNELPHIQWSMPLRN